MPKESQPAIQQSNNTPINNHIAASLFEFIAKTLIERNFFQNYSINSSMLIYLANDLIARLNAKQEEKAENFSLYKELSIMYKQYRNHALTDEEKSYSQQSIHNINILQEIFNGIKYSTGFSILKTLYTSVHSSIAQGLTEHIPAILGYNAAAYIGPYIIAKTIERLLADTALTEKQKNIIRPWLNTIGRLAIGFIPRAEANDIGITYQYPSTSGHYEWYKKIQVSIPQSNTVFSNALPNNADYQLNNESVSFKLHSIHSIVNNHVEVYVINHINEKVLVKFSFTHDEYNPYLIIECADSAIEQQCANYFTAILTHQADFSQTVTTLSSLALPDNPTVVIPPLNDIVGLACSIVIPPMILRTTPTPSLFLSTILSALIYQRSVASAQSIELQNEKFSEIEIQKSEIALQPANLTKIGNINVITLKGSHTEMGIHYGKAMKQQMIEVLDILKAFFITQHKIPYAKLAAHADLFYQRYSYTYQLFLQGMAEGSGLSLNDCKILNGMETLNALIDENKNALGWCAFLSIPPTKTITGSTLIGRNYDFPTPFDKTANYLTVTIINEVDKVPTAIVSMPGQIYCPSCLNAKGIFLELNNGMPSGGDVIDDSRQSLLINMLEYLQNSGSFAQLDKQLSATQSDYSLIINAADKGDTKSFEFSSTLGMKPFNPTVNNPFASTNFYLNTTWKDIPNPSDNTTWMGVTRRTNLLKLASTLDQFDIPSFQSIMERKIENGGAVWDLTIYQIIFDSRNLNLYLKVTNTQDTWTKIPLKDFFDQLNHRTAGKQKLIQSNTNFFNANKSNQEQLQNLQPKINDKQFPQINNNQSEITEKSQNLLN